MPGILDFLPLAGGVLNMAGNIGGSLIQSNAIRQAQQAQGRAQKRAEGAVTGAYDTARGYQQPYAEGGLQDYQTMREMVNSGQFNVSPYDYQQEEFQFKTDPGYQARLQEGNRQITSRAAAGGMQLSGATQKALQRYSQNFAANEVGNAYDRYTQNRTFGANNAWNQYISRNQQATQGYGRMQDLAGFGTGAAANLGNLATAYGSSIAELYGQGGNIQAAGLLGRGQVYGNMASNLGGLAGYYGMQYGTRKPNFNPFGSEKPGPAGDYPNNPDDTQPA